MLLTGGDQVICANLLLLGLKLRMIKLHFYFILVTCAEVDPFPGSILSSACFRVLLQLFLDFEAVTGQILE